MSIKRTAILFGKELLHAPRGFILTMTIAAPLLITLVINLVLGDLFSDRGRLAVIAGEPSQMVTILKESPQIEVKTYNSENELKAAVNRGAADMGVILPVGVDEVLSRGQRVTVAAYIWGESLAKDRGIIDIALEQAARRISNAPEPIALETVTLGDAEAISWSRRLLPMTVMMAIFFGGLMVPATSLIEEKQKHTLEALTVTPASLANIYIAKGMMGAALSLLMGILILLINRAFGGSPVYLLLLLALGAVLASEIGLVLGTLVKDMNTLFAVWKFGGLLLFGPAIIYMFPEIPQWLAYIFPTYYIINPIMNISLGIAGTDAIWQTGVGAGFVVVLAVVLASLIKRLGGEAGAVKEEKQAEA